MYVCKKTISKLYFFFKLKLFHHLNISFPFHFLNKHDSGHIQGIPDLSVDIGPYSYHLEVKRSANAPYRPNQEYYLEKYNSMGGWARTIYPETKEEVLNEMEQTSRIRR